MPPQNQLAEIPEGQGTDLLQLNMKQIFFLGQEMVKAGMITGPKGAAQAAVKIMAGQSMGLDPVASMRGIFIIGEGFGFYANLVAARIKSSPKYDYKVIAITTEACAIEFFEIVGGKRVSMGTERFTFEDAKRQGTKNIDKFPRNMLFARTLSNGAKFYCPDVMSGLPIQTESDLGTLQVIDEPAAEPDPVEVAAEEDRAKAAINRGKKLKPKEEPAPEQEPAESVDKASVETPEPENHESKPVDPTPPQSSETEQPKAQIDGDPATYMQPPVAPPKPAAAEEAFDDTEEFKPHSDAQRTKVMAMLGELGFKLDAEKRKVVAGVLGLETLPSFKQVSFDQAHTLIESLQSSLDAEGGAEGLRMFFVDGQVQEDEPDATAA